MKSKLIESLIHVCENPSKMDYYTKKNLTEAQIELVEALLIKYFKFERIVWLDSPSDDSKAIIALTYKVTEDSYPDHFEDEVCYLYSISFTPKMYNPEDLHKPVKDGCVFAPIIYNPETFEPTRSITLSWNPEFPQDPNTPERTYENDKQMIRDMLEKVLSNPEEYMPEGYRGCLLRLATT